MNTTVHFSRASDEWYTPPAVLAVARATLGAIDLDPASCDEAQATVQAARYYTAADDGLRRPWAGRVWLNPPYSAAGAWLARARSAWQTGEIAAALVLLPARPDTAWFHQHAAAGWLCFWRGRLRFVGAPASAPFPSLLIYYGDEPARFQLAAGQRGLVCPPMIDRLPAQQLSLAAD